MNILTIKTVHLLCDAFESFLGDTVLKAITEGKKRPVEIHLADDSFWSKPRFNSGEEVFVVVDEEFLGDQTTFTGYLVADRSFVEMYCGSISLPTLRRLKSLAKIPAIAREPLIAWAKNAEKNQPHTNKNDFLDESIIPAYYNAVKPFLTVDQDLACARWSNDHKRHSSEKLMYLLSISPNAFETLLKHFAGEAGIRGLKQGMQTVLDRRMLEQRNTSTVTITKEDVDRILPPRPYTYLAENYPGSVNGLGTMGASLGLVMPIRITVLKTRDKRITGLPQDTIRDSIAIAQTWVEEVCGYKVDGYHIHFSPAGVAKSGPSAGISIALALLSAVSGIPIDNKYGFTGEFDGQNILPVGGIDLKLQAAEAAGLQKVFLPEGCRESVNPELYGIEIVFVSTAEDLTRILFSCERLLKNKEEKSVS